MLHSLEPAIERRWLLLLPVMLVIPLLLTALYFKRVYDLLGLLSVLLVMVSSLTIVLGSVECSSGHRCEEALPDRGGHPEWDRAQEGAWSRLLGVGLMTCGR